MGACNTKLTISDSLSVELSSNPNDKVLLMLQLHYDMYDAKSQKKIDELCQSSTAACAGSPRCVPSILTDHSARGVPLVAASANVDPPLN